MYTQGRTQVRSGAAAPSEFCKIVFLDSVFDNLPSPKFFFAPPRLSDYFY
jgi:hypothetical protein